MAVEVRVASERHRMHAMAYQTMRRDSSDKPIDGKKLITNLYRHDFFEISDIFAFVPFNVIYYSNNLIKEYH